ncbi:MAG: helix-turn-helix transcriptional regulator [Pseudobutyrivibrio ruminis]|nr:helix-turn-helix transcriptional regulator [Pseudobutyrivibrio ruminis]
MLQLRIDEILEEQGHTKYWLFKRMEPMSYQNFNKIYNNETSSIKFETLEKLKNALDVDFDDLFEAINKEPKNDY